MGDAYEHVEHKLKILGHLRDMFHARALTNEVLPIELVTVANDLRVSAVRVQQILAELIALKLVTHNPDAPPHTAVSDGRAEITNAGLGYLHQVQSERATAAMNAQLAADNVRLQAALAADLAEQARRVGLEVPEPRSTLKRAGFTPTIDPIFANPLDT